MENPRPEKVAVVQDIKERLEDSQGVLLTEYRGLSVSELAKLRTKLAEFDGEYRVYKNTLVRIATKSIGSAELDEMLNGPTALAFVKEDIAQIAKALKDFSKTNPALILKGGILSGRVLSSDDANKIANLEPRSVMLAKLAGLFQAPVQQFAGLLQAPMQQFAGLLKALIDTLPAGDLSQSKAPDSADTSAADTSTSDTSTADTSATDTSAADTDSTDVSAEPESTPEADSTDTDSTEVSAEPESAPEGS